MKRIVTLDIETEIGEGANPFSPERDVVLLGWHDSEGNKYHESYDEHQHHAGKLTRLLDGTKVLVTFNGKFDIQHLITFPEDYAAWQQFVIRGGVLWDCQLAEYLLRGMFPDAQYLSLNETSLGYGGEEKIDAIAELWAAGVPTREIDRDLLMEYCQQDVMLTRSIFEKQLAIARERGQLKSLLMNMGALCASIEYERNGIYTDVVLGEELRGELLGEIATLNAELQGYIPEEFRPYFKWSSRFHKSALLFGGPAKAERREYLLKDGTYTWTEGHPDQAYVQKTEKHYLMTDGTTLPCALVDTHTEGGRLPINAEKFKSGKNEGQYKTRNVSIDDYTKPKTRMGEFVVQFPGHTTPLREWASTPSGIYKTGEEVMEVLKGSAVPFIKTLVRYTGATKDLSTYFYVEDADGSRTGLMTKVGPDGIIHHKVNHVNTVTGRLSSSDPNMQNLPRKDKSKAKKLFRSRFPGGKIGQSDFSSLEVYVQAILTKARALLETLRSGRDIHVSNLERAPRLSEGKAYDELLRLCKGEGDFRAVPAWKEKRVGAKEISFQQAYGAGVPKIAKTTGMPEEDVAAFIAAFDEANPEIGEYFDALEAHLIANRYPHGGATPHPEVPGKVCHLGRAVFTTPDGKRYGFEERPAPAFLIEKKTQGFSPTERKNYPVQGTGGEIAKMAMWLAVREFYRTGNFDGLALLINFVHDAQYIDAAEEVADRAAVLLHACMLAASPAFERWFKWELPIYVPSETNIGEDWADENPIVLPDNLQQMVDDIVKRNIP